MKLKTWVGTACAALLLAACDSSTGVEADPLVEPFVGRWDAVVLTVMGPTTGGAEPTDTVDVLSFGAFWISVEPSGTYTATIEFPGANPEIGTLTIESPTQLTLRPNGGPPAPGVYVFATPDSLILDGATQFDFNADGTSEPGEGHFELVRAP